MTGLVLDFDGTARRKTIERAFVDYQYFAYSTFSHTAIDQHWRVVLPFSKEHDPRALPLIYQWAQGLGVEPDLSCCQPAKKFFYPERPRGAEFIAWANEGELLDLSDLKAPAQPKKERSPLQSALGRDRPKDSPTLYELNDAAIMHALKAPPGTRLKQKICSLVSEEKHPSTWFWRGRDGLRYHIAHSRKVWKVNPGASDGLAEQESEASKFNLPCPLVLASQVNGRIIAKVRKPELRMWDLRLRERIGAMMPVEIPHKPLPDADSSVPRGTLILVYSGFRQAMGLRAAYNGGEIQPMPFSWRFAARWCGMQSYEDAGAALKQLMAWGLIRTEGSYIAFGKECNLLTTTALLPYDESSDK